MAKNPDGMIAKDRNLADMESEVESLSADITTAIKRDTISTSLEEADSKRSVHAIALNVARSLVVNTAVITLLPLLFGGAIVWFTFGISECVVLLLAAILLCVSERGGIVYR